MRLPGEVGLDASHFRAQSFFSLLLRDGAHTHGDANAEISLVDEQPPVREDGDACCACRGHELLLWTEEHFRKGLTPGATCGANEGRDRHVRLLRESASGCSAIADDRAKSGHAGRAGLLDPLTAISGRERDEH